MLFAVSPPPAWAQTDAGAAAPAPGGRAAAKAAAASANPTATASANPAAKPAAARRARPATRPLPAIDAALATTPAAPPPAAPPVAADPPPPPAPDAPRSLADLLGARDAQALSSLLASALPADPQVRVARALLDAGGQRRLQARSRLAPNVALNLAKGRSQGTELGLPLDRRSERADIALRWNLYNGGNDLAELDASTLEQMAAQEDLRRAYEDSAERIAEAYLDLLRLEGLVPRAAERLAGVQRLVAMVSRQNQLGKAADTDAQQARASLLDAEIALDQLESDRAGARDKLRRLIGQDPGRVTPVMLPTPPAGEPLATGQLASAQLRAQAARQRVRPVASLAAPRIDLEVRKSLSDNTRPQTTTLENQAWGMSARWDFPVGGETIARRGETAARADAAEAEVQRLVSGQRAELDALLPRLDNSERALARLDSQLAEYRSLLKAGELQFEAGRRSLSQLITLHDSRFMAEQRRAEQQHRLLSTQLRRLSLTGQLLPALVPSLLPSLAPSVAPPSGRP